MLLNRSIYSVAQSVPYADVEIYRPIKSDSDGTGRPIGPVCKMDAYVAHKAAETTLDPFLGGCGSESQTSYHRAASEMKQPAYKAGQRLKDAHAAFRRRKAFWAFYFR